MADLVAIGDESITVSDTAIGPTAAEVTSAVRMATFHLVAGGTIYHRITAAAVATGANGEIGQALDDHWEVWGRDNVLNFTMIKRTGESDATVQVQYFGSGN